jgi:hypothetical protein
LNGTDGWKARRLEGVKALAHPSVQASQRPLRVSLLTVEAKRLD